MLSGRARLGSGREASTRTRGWEAWGAGRGDVSGTATGDGRRATGDGRREQQTATHLKARDCLVDPFLRPRTVNLDLVPPAVHPRESSRTRAQRVGTGLRPVDELELHRRSALPQCVVGLHGRSRCPESAVHGGGPPATRGRIGDAFLIRQSNRCVDRAAAGGKDGGLVVDSRLEKRRDLASPAGAQRPERRDRPLSFGLDRRGQRSGTEEPPARVCAERGPIEREPAARRNDRQPLDHFRLLLRRGVCHAAGRGRRAVRLQP